MNAFLREIETSLVQLLGQGIKLLPGLITAVIILLLTRYAAEAGQRVANGFGQRVLRNQSLKSLLVRTTFVATWIVGILAASVVAFPGLGLGDLVATLGLGSVAIGFAFQDIFKNFLAGILLLIQEPFQMGDQIIVGDYEGTVEEINIRSTSIRTYLGERVLVPNSLVFTSPVQVRTAFQYRRTDLAVGVDYSTPLSQAQAILARAIAAVDGVVDKPAPEIDLISFNDSSIDFMVRYWTLPQQAEVRRTQTRAIIAIKAALDQADISIPFPIRTLYFADQVAQDALAQVAEGNSHQP